MTINVHASNAWLSISSCELRKADEINSPGF